MIQLYDFNIPSYTKGQLGAKCELVDNAGKMQFIVVYTNGKFYIVAENKSVEITAKSAENLRNILGWCLEKEKGAADYTDPGKLYDRERCGCGLCD